MTGSPSEADVDRAEAFYRRQGYDFGADNLDIIRMLAEFAEEDRAAIAAMGQATDRDAVIEECAHAHDLSAAQCREAAAEFRQSDVDVAKENLWRAEFHETSAKCMRALKSSPPEKVTAPTSPARHATIVLPEGYGSAQAFADDCGFELVPTCRVEP
jgi:hypothetical protein